MKKLFATASIFALCACTDGGEFDLPKLGLDANWGQEIPLTKQSELKQEWWKSFKDENLNHLIESATSQNFDVKIAESKILEARQGRIVAETALMPQVNFEGSASRSLSPLGGGFSKNPKPVTLFETGFDAMWEADLFGQNAARVDEAGFNQKALEANLNAVKLTLIAEIVTNYLDLRSAQTGIKLTNQKIAAQEKILDLKKHLQKSGLADGAEVSRNESALTSIKATMPDIEARLESAKNRLVTLTSLSAAEVDKIADQAFVDNVDKAPPPISKPTDLIANRPDIIAAGNNLLASMANAKAADLEHFPKISLGAFLGVGDSSITNSTEVWKLGGNLVAPIINFGKIDALATAAKEQEKQALEEYKKAIALAVEDVKNSAVYYIKAGQNLHLETQQLTEQQTQERLITERFDKGLNSKIDVYQQQLKALDSQIAVNLATARFYKRIVGVYKSIGVI
jgi:multidrug efflux system outer membrane protein